METGGTQTHKKKITLRDISQRTGLSINTVSKVLNKKPYYTKEVEQKVLQAIAELGYIVDLNAAGLRSGSTHTVAIIFDDIASPFYSYMTDAIAKRFDAAGYDTVIFSNYNRNAYVDETLLRRVLARKPDGILSFLVPSPEAVGLIRRHGIPFLIFGRSGETYGLPSVHADTEAGGRIAAEHLLARNYRRTAFVGSEAGIDVGEERLRGYAKVLEEHGIALEETPVLYIKELGYERVVQELLRANVNGIFCYNDIIAFKVIGQLKKAGKRAGKDYGIVGYDNIQSMLELPEMITTIDVGNEALAAGGAVRMLGLLQGKNEEFFPDGGIKPFLVKGPTT